MDTKQFQSKAGNEASVLKSVLVSKSSAECAKV